MTIVEELLAQRSTTIDGRCAIDRELAIQVTRARLDDDVVASDAEIWALWQRGMGGPTCRDDLCRIVAQLEGIALDG
jgi:hypothetical protein